MHDTSITSKIIPITDLRRRFGDIEAMLARVEELILTKKGRPFATIRASDEVKRELMETTAGALKGTGWGEDPIWKEILDRRPTRKPPVKL